MRSTITEPKFTHPAPAIAQTEEYSSGASDGSDVEISDDELAKELLTLTEEERDLREYTAIMSVSRIRGQRRVLGSRSTGILVKGPRNTNHPVATIYSAVRNARPAAANRARRPTTSHPQTTDHTSGIQLTNEASNLTRLSGTECVML